MATCLAVLTVGHASKKILHYLLYKLHDINLTLVVKPMWLVAHVITVLQAISTIQNVKNVLVT